mgnify:CR=1 FL=1
MRKRSNILPVRTVRTQKHWPAIMREDGRRMEIICPHGVGHPVKSLSRNWDDSWMGVHSCDGCCYKAEFALSELAHQAKVKS